MKEMSIPVSPSCLSAHDAIVGRRSIRSFLPSPVPDNVINSILGAASRAPSGTNSQPWFVHVVSGETRIRLSAQVKAAAERGEMTIEYVYEPKIMREPYLSRRRKIGLDLYALCGIDRHDKVARARAFLRNYEFFGAPVGLFVTIERDLELGSWLYCGMFIQNIMTIARAYGLETCAQQAWCDYGAIIRRETGIPEEQIIVMGMAIGDADQTAPENGLVTERVEPEDFAMWHR